MAGHVTLHASFSLKLVLVNELNEIMFKMDYKRARNVTENNRGHVHVSGKKLETILKRFNLIRCTIFFFLHSTVKEEKKEKKNVVRERKLG